jgi:Spy/CpxP family protein refolding chaperone
MSPRLTKVLLGLSLLLNLFVLTGFAYRSWIAPPTFVERRPPWQAPGGSPPGNPPNPLEMLAHELNLDDAQRLALRDVFEQYNTGRTERYREMQKVREQMVAELQHVPIDYAKLEPIVDRLSGLRGELQKDNLRVMKQIEPGLRPDQRQRFETMLAERLGGWWGRPGGPRGSRGGPGGPNRPSQ